MDQYIYQLRYRPEYWTSEAPIQYMTPEVSTRERLSDWEELLTSLKEFISEFSEISKILSEFHGVKDYSKRPSLGDISTIEPLPIGGIPQGYRHGPAVHNEEEAEQRLFEPNPLAKETQAKLDDLSGYQRSQVMKEAGEAYTQGERRGGKGKDFDYYVNQAINKLS